jgi:tetratricopeptide (TPR) repeat protein
MIRVAILLVLISASAIAQEGTRSYSNTGALVEIDWGEGGPYEFATTDPDSRVRKTYTGEKWRVISLRSGDSWNGGNCWIITADINSNQKDNLDDFSAYKGTYDFFNPSDGQDNMLILRLALQREYNGSRSKDGIDWTMYTKFKPFGTVAEIPLEEGNTVPSDKIVFSFMRGFFINESGQEIERHSDPVGFKEHIFGTDPMKVRTLRFASVGESLKTSRAPKLLAQLGLDKDPPPGFQIRKLETRETTFRTDPTAETKKKKTAELTDRAFQAQEAKKFDDCIEACTELIEIDGANDWAYCTRAVAYNSKKEFRKAVVDYKKCLALNPDDTTANNNLGWLRATCAQSTIRNGAEAVQFAKKACQLTKYENGFYFDTLAAAYAENGDFEKAVLWQSNALESVAAKDKQDFEARLKLYQNKLPCRDN